MKALMAFVRKEMLQILRDPSSILIAIVLPTILSLIYMYGINMDAVSVNMGIRVEDSSVKMDTLIQSFSKNNYVKAYVYDNKNQMYDDIVSSKLQGAVIIPGNFTNSLETGQLAQVLIITDGSESNTANYVQAYGTGIIQQWMKEAGYTNEAAALITPVTRMWYNQDENSHYFILPGSLATTLSLVGLLLTALVVAREWERGTMEALLSTRLRPWQFVMGKYLAYYTLGIGAFWFNIFLCITVFAIPFRGSYTILMIVGSLFLLACMGIGLLISTVFKNQFLACQISLMIGFLPSLLLSGLMFPISSMPDIFQYITMVLPQRYFVSFIESEFLAGTIFQVVLINTIYLSVLCVVLAVLVYKKTLTRLE